MPASRLTPERMLQIVEDVRKGAYAKVAAQNAGIEQNTFRVWFMRGKGMAEQRADAELHDTEFPPVEKYEEFYRQVSAAQAEARTKAEQRLYETNPKYWLTHGPARDDWRPAKAAEEKKPADLAIDWIAIRERERALQAEAAALMAAEQELREKDPLGWLKLQDAARADDEAQGVMWSATPPEEPVTKSAPATPNTPVTLADLADLLRGEGKSQDGGDAGE